MRRIVALLVGGAILLLAAPAPVMAQDSAPVIFGVYYRCSQGAESRADEIVEQTLGSVIQPHVDAGHLTGWLWLSHRHGGGWRRILATVGTDLDQMMDVRGQIFTAFQNDHPDAAAELGTVCGSHDDYIWIGVANSDPDPNAIGDSTLSAYHACDMSREARADEIFSEILAPLYQKHMDMGHLSSWGFYAHRVGGIFRRLETMSGADHTTLMAMQTAIYQEAGQSNPLEMQEFRSICSWHSDYMWQNTLAQ